MNVEWIATLERCIKENGGKIDGYLPRTITLPKPMEEMPFGARNAARELELEWDYKVVISDPDKNQAHS
jgi:hypothetical protein